MAITSITKGGAGVEDLLLDVSGKNEIAVRASDTGGSTPVRRINASHLPTTKTTRETDGHDGSDNEALNVDSAIAKLFSQLFDIGKPDDATVEANGASGSRVLRLKALGIETSHIQDLAVSSDKIALLAITAALLADNAVTTDKILNDAVTAVKILDAAVSTDKIADGAVNAQKIEDRAIGRTKINFDGLDTNPGGFIVQMGTHTLTGGLGTTEAHGFPVAVGGTDILIATAASLAAGCWLEHASISGGQASYHFNIDPGAGALMTYIVIRPVTT